MSPPADGSQGDISKCPVMMGKGGQSSGAGLLGLFGRGGAATQPVGKVRPMLAKGADIFS